MTLIFGYVATPHPDSHNPNWVFSHITLHNHVATPNLTQTGYVAKNEPHLGLAKHSFLSQQAISSMSW